ncbi:MAG: TonB-dependent receptor [Ignavibacteriaceae bacterium]|nr:TonB-dependent receptor [Ignavibacteriaceae bacterium]
MNKKFRRVNNFPGFSFLLFLICLICFQIDILGRKDSIQLSELSLKDLLNIEISSASKVTQKVSEVPATIFVITGKELKERGVQTLDEALAVLPGFQFRDITGINSYIFLRGVTNQNNLTLLLIDGIQINELNSGGFYAGGVYNLANIERIEVVYGPSSVAYGTNAVSGVINLITKNPRNKVANASFGAGNFGTKTGDVSYSFSDDENNLGILFSGRVRTTDKAELGGKKGDYNWSEQMENYEEDYAFDLRGQYKDLTFGTSYLNKRTPTTTLEKSAGRIYQDRGTLWNIRFINNYVKYGHSFSGGFKGLFSVYHRDATVLDNSIYYVTDTAQVGYCRPNNLVGGEAVLNYKTGKSFSLSGGITFEYERLAQRNTYSYSSSPQQTPPVPPYPIMLSNSLMSMFLEPKYSPINELHLQAGVRFDNSSYYDRVFTPRVGIVYSFPASSIRFSYAEAFRAPKPWDYTDGLGNAALKPETFRSFETGIEYDLSGNCQLDFAGYFNKLRGAIVSEVTTAGTRWINKGEVKTAGIDMLLRYLVNDLTASLAYSYLESYDEKGQFLKEIAKHSGSASVLYRFKNNICANLSLHYSGNRENPAFITTTGDILIDPYWLLNGAVTYTNFYGFSFQFIIKNIFDAEYYHTSNRTPSRYRQPQRTFLIRVEYDFTL